MAESISPPINGKPLFVMEKPGDPNTLYDLTSKILVPTYNVNNQPVYEEWTRIDGIKRRQFIRDRIAGSFDIWYDNIPQYRGFIDMMVQSKNACLETYVRCLYVNNTLQYVAGRFFVTFKMKNEMPILSQKHDGFTVNIQEV